MKRGKKYPNLEDILGNDRTPEDPALRALAGSVEQVIRNAGNEPWDPADKAALWEEIAPGLVPQPVRYRYLYLKVAAAILVLLAAGLWYFQPRPNDLLRFARQLPREQPLTDTRLLVGQHQAVVVKGKNAALVYAGGGTGVTINKDTLSIAAATYNTLMVPYGRRARVQLEDGSVVQLNAGSRLVYPAAFKNGKREVYLEGEAFFDIAPNSQSPFFVYASGLVTEVLGTTFNISAYPDDTRQSLVLASGSVRLHVPGHGFSRERSQLLQPADMATVDAQDGGLQMSRVNVASYTAWKDGRLLFSNTPLKEILKKLTRYYNIPLDLASTKPGLETCSGDLDLEDNLDNVLEVICATNSLRYERYGQRIVLTEKE